MKRVGLTSGVCRRAMCEKGWPAELLSALCIGPARSRRSDRGTEPGTRDRDTERETHTATVTVRDRDRKRGIDIETHI